MKIFLNKFVEYITISLRKFAFYIWKFIVYVGIWEISKTQKETERYYKKISNLPEGLKINFSIREKQ